MLVLLQAVLLGAVMVEGEQHIAQQVAVHYLLLLEVPLEVVVEAVLVLMLMAMVQVAVELEVK